MIASSRLPYYLGCPSWQEPAWRDCLALPGQPATDALTRYAQHFNAVEGNTTFYAAPTSDTIERWSQSMPEDFRFCAKLPRSVSHGASLLGQLESALAFAQLLAPLGVRVQPYWLQLPASFAPDQLWQLKQFIQSFSAPLAVEVRHPAFFRKGDEERELNRLLRDQGVERICLDSRALFSCHSQEAAVLHAQSKKPRVPPRPTAFSANPQLRFIGHPDLLANDPFLTPWLHKVAGWIEQGLRPYVFMHTSDNRLAPQLAYRFHQQLMALLPGLPALPGLQPEAQLALL